MAAARLLQLDESSGPLEGLSSSSMHRRRAEEMEERGIGVVVVGGQVKCLPLAPVVRVVLDTNERARAAGRGRANQRVENQSAISNCRQIFLSVLGGGGGNVDGDGQSFHRTTSVTESNLFFFSSISLSSRLPFAPHPTAEIECCRIGGGPRLRAAPCPSPLLSSRRAEPRLDRTPVSRVDHQSSQMEQYLVDHGLKVTVVDTKGRCLVADRDFSPGEIVLDQEPYSSVLDAESKSLRCDACFRCSENLQRCSACKSVSYCCTSCQRKEWKLHKSECQMMVKLSQAKQKLPPPSLRLIVRLVIKRRLQASNVFPRTNVDNFEIVEALPTHFSETGEERLVLYAQMSNLVKAIVTPLEVDLKETCELFCRIACNAHTICDDEFRPVGTGLYPVVSIINHSCAPNSVLLFDGRRAIVRAIQKIDRGTEETTEGTREDSILEGYKCSNEQCDGAVIQERDQPYFRCILCGLTHDGDKFKRLESMATKLTEEANAAVKSGSTVSSSVDMSRPIAGLCFFKVCMSLKDWNAALKYCHLTLPAYERSYSMKSPLVGLQYYTLGKLQWFLGDSLEEISGVEVLNRAKEILSITHGSSSKLVQELSSMLLEVNMEAAYRVQKGLMK
ncbi:hypothetical protein AXG93_939s1030 [Marchantia polymorpha subsp. ruderalis]|uniref:MYND-type domain-containing protein n=1 Tax=Marchantia polymorpha subsp. ruderalis TaxID=1480154 RepID=A0A176VLX4_MARPO|nr:hypothetical protein AXG93_939s1030 [Marchantia polymorpha subsp. ruderalis]